MRASVRQGLDKFSKFEFRSKTSKYLQVKKWYLLVTLHCPIYVTSLILPGNLHYIVLSMYYLCMLTGDMIKVKWSEVTTTNPRRNLTSILLKMGIKKRPFLGQFGHSNPLKSSTLSAEAIGTIKNYKLLLETCGILSWKWAILNRDLVGF